MIGGGGPIARDALQFKKGQPNWLAFFCSVTDSQSLCLRLISYALSVFLKQNF